MNTLHKWYVMQHVVHMTLDEERKWIESLFNLYLDEMTKVFCKILHQIVYQTQANRIWQLTLMLLSTRVEYPFDWRLNTWSDQISSCRSIDF